MEAHYDWLRPEVLESIADGFVFLDRELRYVYVNAEAEKLLLRKRGELVGRMVWDVYREPPGSVFREAVEEALRTGKPTHVDALNGRRGVWFDVHTYPSEQGISIIFRDITAQKQAEEAIREQARELAVINRVNATLAAELDLERLVQSVTDAGTELTEAQFGAFFYNVVDRDGESYMLYTISGVPREAFSKFPMPRNTPVFHATFSGEGVVRSDDIKKDPRYGKWAPHYGMPPGHLPVSSYLAVPVVARSGEVIGGLFFGHEEAGVFTERAERIVQGIADQAAIAIENARLYQSAQAEIRERELAETRMRLLARASALLGSSLDYETTLRHVGQFIVPDLADWYSIHLLTESGAVERVTVAHVDPAKVKWAQELGERYPVDLNASSGTGHVIRTGQPAYIPEITEEMIAALEIQDEEMLRVVRQLNLRSIITVPLKGRERTLGALSLIWSDTDRHYTKEDLQFAEELAARTALAIENAQLYGEARTAEAHLRALNEELEARVLERTQELEGRNRELQDFAYVASHDLQEPLRKVHSFADLLKDEYGDRLDEDGQMFLQRIQNATLRMSGLIRDLLQYSRVSTNSQNFENVDLNVVVLDVLSDLEVRIKDVNGKVLVQQLPEVEADPVQMRQLFQNLIANALKFHKPEVPPVVKVTASGYETNLEDSMAGPGCRLEVADNGIGFDPKYADRIFQPFQRLHTRDVYTGTGVGLAICKRIVERHNGSIDVDSSPGEGTTFTITLPCQQKAVAA
ncbi:MAG TPA: GAF domain-containing protein [Rhodothermales bacterium]|nr:GAF domain-containing protein [Rhodothermales bacterium]